MGIRRVATAPYHPRANGMVERYIGVIKAGFRKMKVSFPEGEWIDFLPDILAGLRVMPSRSGYSPFLLVYKQEAHWPVVSLEVAA